MALLIGGALALLGIAVAIYPFVRHRFFGEPPGPDFEEGDSLLDAGAILVEDELAEIYDAISTLRLERELGNVPEGLYREQLNGYRLRAARALRSREPESDDGEDWVLEEEIRVARSGISGSSVGAFPSSNCGSPASAELADCPECGAEPFRPDAGTILPSGAEDTER